MAPRLTTQVSGPRGGRGRRRPLALAAVLADLDAERPRHRRDLMQLLRRFWGQEIPDADKSDPIWYLSTGRYIADGRAQQARRQDLLTESRDVLRRLAMGQMTCDEYRTRFEQSGWHRLYSKAIQQLDEIAGGRAPLVDKKTQEIIALRKVESVP